MKYLKNMKFEIVTALKEHVETFIRKQVIFQIFFWRYLRNIWKIWNLRLWQRWKRMWRHCAEVVNYFSPHSPKLTDEVHPRMKISLFPSNISLKSLLAILPDFFTKQCPLKMHEYQELLYLSICVMSTAHLWYAIFHKYATFYNVHGKCPTTTNICPYVMSAAHLTLGTLTPGWQHT